MSTLNREQIVGICGELLDWQVLAIIDSGATAEDVEEAVAYASGQDDVMGEARKPLAGKAAIVHEILTRDEEFAEADRPLEP